MKKIVNIFALNFLISTAIYAASQSQSSSIDGESRSSASLFSSYPAIPELPFATQVPDYEWPADLMYGGSLSGSLPPPSEEARLRSAGTPATDTPLTPHSHAVEPASQSSEHTVVVPAPMAAPGAVRRSDGSEYFPHSGSTVDLGAEHVSSMGGSEDPHATQPEELPAFEGSKE